MATALRSLQAALPVSIALFVLACSDVPPVAPDFAASEPPSLSFHVGRATLVVDDDGADCAHAGYNTIQAAVDAAAPGTTIVVCAGLYNERVLISGAGRNGLRLLAHGQPGTVLLDGVGLPAPGPPGSPTGNHGIHLLNVDAVLVQGFTLRRYFENIRLTGASDSRIRGNHTSGAGHDGITVASSAGNLIEHNVSFDNLSANACGVLLTVGSVDNVIRDNVLRNNNWGIRIVGGSTGNHVFHNESRGNRSHGIQNVGGTTVGTVIENNRVGQNPTGIQILQSSWVTVARNHAFDNALDLADGGTDNVFVNNHCLTSDPDGLCAHSHGASQ